MRRLVIQATKVMRGYRRSTDAAGRPTGWMQPDNCKETDLEELSKLIKSAKAEVEADELEGKS